MEHKDKIDFDLNFLDKNTKEKPKQQSKSKDPNWVYHKDGPGAKNPNAPSSDGMSDNAKKWAWGIGLVLLFIVIGAFSDDSSTSSSTNSGMVQNGDFMCSSYNSTAADNLGPTASERSSIDSTSSSLDYRGDALASEKDDIESEYVDEYDQDSIDEHNERIDDLNYRLQRYRNDLDAYEDARLAYNTKIQAYNDYLTAHCTRN